MSESSARKNSADNGTFPKGAFVVIVLILLLVAVQFSLTNGAKGLVKGVKTEADVSAQQKKVEAAKERLSGTVADQLDQIKKQVVQLDPQDIVTSSPQVQKVIEDLKNLQGVPQDELKNVCENICKGL